MVTEGYICNYRLVKPVGYSEILRDRRASWAQ